METTITNDIVIENENIDKINNTTTNDSKEFLVGIIYLFKKLFLIS